jgi:aminoglycoside/choline kinase family phosphotransferase
VDKLTWEMNFFIKHFLEAYRGAVITSTDRQALDEELSRIVAELAAEPRVLCHRDYHSRNLMLLNDRLQVIDFQDARMGPDTYDMVSLLRDSYVDLPEDLVDGLIQEFLVMKGQAGAARVYRTRFNLMALQRNLKALGTFGYQTTARGNPVYIQYIPRTLRYAGDNLRSTDRLSALRRVLTKYVPELQG